jgi:gliding motility-associated-like protein/uncharacterized repeat protein (TIGR01451 family)
MELKKHLQTLFLATALILLSGIETNAQQIYASSASEISSGNRVDNAANATAANGEFATVRSYGGVALGIGAYSGALKLEFTNSVPANTTAYIKVDGENNGLFDSLLGGSLGVLLSNEAGAALLGDHYVEILALNTLGTTVASGRTDNLTSSSTLKVVRDKEGDIFIAITPKAAYTSLVVKDVTDALLLGTENFTNVYHAFYINETPTICIPEGTFTSYDGTGITLDLLNLGATGVNNPEFAIDGDSTTYATISVGIISAFASMSQDIQFLNTASDTDQLEINISTQEGRLLNVALLQNIQIDLYEEDLVVYSTSLAAANIIAIQPSEALEIQTIIIKPNTKFDKLRMTLSSPVGINLAQQINLFSTKIKTAPPTLSEGDENQSFCTVDIPKISDLKANVTGTLIWYNQANGRNAFALTDTLLDGFTYYASNFNGSCESNPRLAVFVTLRDASTPVGSSLQSFCKVKKATIADLEVSSSGTVTWYDQATGGNTYTNEDYLLQGQQYYASNFDGTCESSMRLKVTVTISDIDSPEGSSPQNFCSENNPTISDLQASGSGTIVWYDQESEGNMYAIDTPLVDGVQYYAANSDGTCESSNRLEVTALLTNLDAPTGENIQKFCSDKAPKIADLNTSSTNTVVWYDQSAAGKAYDTDTPLIDGLKYYGANSNGDCESKERLEVTVAIENISTPTTTCTNQSFCVIDAAKIADLDATASGNVIWYNQVTNGNAYSPDTSLIDGLEYYGANSNGTCESSDRLAITVSITDSNAPEGMASQRFCDEEMPTIRDLEVSATGTIIWYNQEVGGDAYNSEALLEDGLSYYASNSVSLCESSIRLKVTVLITNTVAIKIQGNTEDVCFGTREIYIAPSGYAPYAWDIVGGEIISGGSSEDNTIEIEWQNLTDTAISVSLTGGCFNKNTAEQAVEIVTCSDLTIVKKVDIVRPSFGDTVFFTIQVENSSLSIFKAIQVFEILSSGFIYVSKSTTLGAYNEDTGIWNIPTLGANQSATLTIEAKIHTIGSYLNTAQIIESTPIDADTTNNTAKILVTPLCLKIYNTITPNGDGMNDYFVISCIENFPNNTIEIYDRYGSIIYKKKNYRNDWNGIANQTSKIIRTGEKLPNGTYFFILKLNDGNTKDTKSYIQIIK